MPVSIITLLITVYLANGTPIVYSFTVPTQEHCSQDRVKQYIEFFILPSLAPGQQIQKLFGGECKTTEPINPSDDLIPLPVPADSDEGQSSEPLTPHRDA